MEKLGNQEFLHCSPVDFIFCCLADFSGADSPISSRRMSLFFLMTQIYPLPSRELSANIGCHQRCLISIESHFEIKIFQDLSDICKIICHLHPAFQKIYWWKLSVLCPSKTVENHLSWLANRDKITNENKRPIFFFELQHSCGMHINIHTEDFSTKKASLGL